ncbi:MAG TPA: hypothetical protein VKB04_10210 [Anaerolineales bacterium]|nr:hypothetical protein [Anaerolineales bacterium]
MNKAKKSILFLLLVIALLAIPTFVVFAKELGMLTISGPGIKGELTLKDPKAMMNLEQSGFFDESTLSKPPENLNLEAGYTVTAHLNLDGKVVPFVQIVYYPTNAGQAGYIHYTGRLDGETLQAVDEWHLMRLEADKTFRELMTANNVTLQSALITAPAAAAPAVHVEPAAVPATSAAPAQVPYLIPIMIAAILLLIGAGFALKRRTVSHPTI